MGSVAIGLTGFFALTAFLGCKKALALGGLLIAALGRIAGLRFNPEALLAVLRSSIEED